MDGNMILFLLTSVFLQVECQPRPVDCALGYMTHVQSWVDEHGQLTKKIDKSYSIDLSSKTNPTVLLQQHVETSFRSESEQRSVRYLSLARCGLSRFPTTEFKYIYDSQGRNLSDTLEYLSLYGNRFVEVSVPGEGYDVTLHAINVTETKMGIRLKGDGQVMWSKGFKDIKFAKLRQLDLRACMIQTIGPYLFKNMPELEALYLAENLIYSIASNAFAGLGNLLHLDLSRNSAFDAITGSPKLLDIEDRNVFLDMENLTSIDFSHSKLSQRAILALSNTGTNIERISLCFVGSIKMGDNFFRRTNLKILDVSGNYEILSSFSVLSGLENSLEVLQANDVGLHNFDMFYNFKQLRYLGVNRNEIAAVKPKTAQSLINLRVLDLGRNRISSWFQPVFTKMPQLKVLLLSQNNINMMSEEMLRDFSNISYVDFAGNAIICNCNSKIFVAIAARNELIRKELIFDEDKHFNISLFSNFHMVLGQTNRLIAKRKNMSSVCSQIDCYEDDWDFDGNYLLLDYNPENYSCMMLPDSTLIQYIKASVCEVAKTGAMHDLEKRKKQLLALLTIPCFLLPALLLGFIFRRNLRYCYVTMRNSAMLSMVNKNKIIDDDTIFNYDVFVSYCNDDRTWVLDQLLSHLEHDCSVSLCLHERDFQVGLSILENIVSCMDRSKFIMLVISKQFLLSQWCQFEMHLAQHRLLETRREDLILILLEDIPRRLRPNTLHYLMLTKTYIIWPKNKSEQHLFWKRLKKTAVTQKQKQQDNVSLA